MALRARHAEMPLLVVVAARASSHARVAQRATARGNPDREAGDVVRRRIGDTVGGQLAAHRRHAPHHGTRIGEDNRPPPAGDVQDAVLPAVRAFKRDGLEKPDCLIERVCRACKPNGLPVNGFGDRCLKCGNVRRLHDRRPNGDAVRPHARLRSAAAGRRQLDRIGARLREAARHRGAACRLAETMVIVESPGIGRLTAR